MTAPRRGASSHPSSLHPNAAPVSPAAITHQRKSVETGSPCRLRMRRKRTKAIRYAAVSKTICGWIRRLPTRR